MNQTLSHTLVVPLLKNATLLIPHLFDPGGVNLAGLHKPFEDLELQLLQETGRFDTLQEQVHDLQRTLNEHLRRTRTDYEERLCYTLHDVKNVLAGLTACLEVVRSDELEQKEREELLQLIVNDVRRVLTLVHEFETFSYRNDNTASQSPVWSLADLIEEICSMLAPSFSYYGISIRTNLRYTGSLKIEHWKMKHVILNIAYNARDAMPKGGTFTISSELSDNQIILEFTDTGCGMSPKIQAHFLEPLMTEGKPHGTGLGMAIVKEILDAHQARLDVESTIRQGTTMRIIFSQFQ